ncbi:SusC/RagA family TonB-linked outer membrane protein [Hymenobacter sp. BT186]|uniref:SusC/RagA family TonB-linked outer membrane protein n=1 Tax=Hymenobacter telluris TaxID=2816474 RepID=A0A939JB90_9BACT|nr:SusC/RagA family TonB-linked outer membrane protein [Hymenobacter telluris]MBO0358886.1 SusC/RagA family TonB-linked outer membrane protein [Hymenobacter telluris]MBW3374912.1 SusC/RagA family TonB-linked outer membrane protein [Hymenobacter norwichensis]
MNRLYLLAPALGAVVALPGHAQQNLRTISGTVTSVADRSPLPGVTVLVKGTTIGASTGADGRYTIQAAPGSTLIFSFIGYTTLERAIGDGNTLDIGLKENTTELNDVIVTAFGIAQERRQVNYGAQQVTSKDIIESRQPNIVNALQGKVAGVQVTSSGGGAGEGASIVIRGGNSLDGDNQPLFVIDGIIMDNTSFAESTAPGGGSAFNGIMGRSVSSPNRAADINPEDVESMTVLKGPAAAALYGLRAANGAVIITTKKGKSGAVTVDFRTQVSVDRVNRLPQLQDKYKQGAAGIFDPSTRVSWGPQFAEGEPVYDNLNDFYKTAYSYQNYLTITGGTDKGSFLLSASNLNQTGVAPNSEFDKSTVRLSGTLQVSPKLKAQGSAQYLNSGGRRPLQGPGLFGGSGGYMVSLLNWPRNDDARNYLNPDGTRRRLIGGVGSSDADNPYFTVERNPVTDRTNRLIGNAQLTYQPAKWATLSYNLGTDVYTETVRSIRAVGTSQPNNQDGGISETTNQSRLVNSYLTAVFTHSFNDNISGSLLLGNSVEQSRRESTDIIGLVFRSPNFNSINNTVNRGALTTNSLRRLVGNFARLNFDLFKQVTVELSARYDMSSTLPRPSQNKDFGQGFLYGAATLGYEFSRTLGLDNNSILNYGKLRLSVAEVGKDTGPYRVESPLAQSTYIGGGFRPGFYGSNSQLIPERTRSYEAGLDFQFLKGRLGLDAGVYYAETRDQLIAPRVSQASGYILQYINGGTVTNTGVEIALNGRPVVTKSGFTWDVLANFFHNENRAKKLPSFLTEVNQSDAWVIDVARGSAFPNRPITSIGVIDYARVTDPNSEYFGQVLINATTGYPSVVAGNFVYAGDRAPQFTTQITNTLAYKGLSLAFMLDFRKGGDVVNGNEWVAVRSGLSKKTLDRNQTAVIDGAVRNADGSYAANTRPVELTQGYFINQLAGTGWAFVEDGSWTRLRYATLAYSLPKKLLSGTFVKGAELSVTGRNLLLFTNYSGADPETAAAGAGVRGGGSGGFDYGSTPATRGVDMALRVNF